MSEETFENLLAPNLQSIRRLVQRRVRTAHQADDIVQQSLLRAFACRDQLRSQSKFKSWLWSIALNEIRMFLRDSRPGVSLDDLPNFQFADRTPSPLALCEETETAERLRAAMARLSMRDRTAIRLADLNGLTTSEAAGVMAISKAAFKSTHFRARQRLGDALRVMQTLAAPRFPAKGKQRIVYQVDLPCRTSPALRIAA